MQRTLKSHLNVQSLLAKIVDGKTLLKRRTGTTLFSQGEKADAIYFIKTGRAQLIVVSRQGRKALLSTRGPHDFLGEECLVGGACRTSTATLLEPSTVLRIEKRAMLQAIHRQPGFSLEFVTSLLARNVDMEEDLCDQLLNDSEYEGDGNIKVMPELLADTAGLTWMRMSTSGQRL